MRIDLYGPAATTEAIEQTRRTGTEKAANAKKQLTVQKNATEDKATLSSGTDSVSSLTKAALQPVPTREAKVEALKQAVHNAQYQLDSAKIAEAISSTDV